MYWIKYRKNNRINFNAKKDNDIVENCRQRYVVYLRRSIKQLKHLTPWFPIWGQFDF